MAHLPITLKKARLLQNDEKLTFIRVKPISRILKKQLLDDTLKMKDINHLFMFNLHNTYTIYYLLKSPISKLSKVPITNPLSKNLFMLQQLVSGSRLQE